MENPPSNTTSPWVLRLIIAGFVLLAFMPVVFVPAKREIRRWQAAAAAMQATRLYENDAPAEAIDAAMVSLREIAAADPSDTTNARLLARTFQSLDRSDEAIEIYDELLTAIERATSPPPTPIDDADGTDSEPEPIDLAEMPLEWRQLFMMRNAALHQGGRFRELATYTSLLIEPREATAKQFAEASNRVIPNSLRADVYSSLASLYNTRAYARALGDFELDEGKEDIDKALQYQSRATQLRKSKLADQLGNDWLSQVQKWLLRVSESLAEPEPADDPAEISGEAMLLDTRGYLLYQRGKPGDDEAALEDLNIAIDLIQANSLDWEKFFFARRSQVARVKELENQFLQIEESIAVIYNHRGLVHQRLGNVTEAEADFQVVRDLGLVPGADLN